MVVCRAGKLVLEATNHSLSLTEPSLLNEGHAECFLRCLGLG
jgi:hypothetical protein